MYVITKTQEKKSYLLCLILRRGCMTTSKTHSLKIDTVRGREQKGSKKETPKLESRIEK